MTRYMSKQSFIGTKQKREKTRQALTDHEFHEAQRSEENKTTKKFVRQTYLTKC